MILEQIRISMSVSELWVIVLVVLVAGVLIGVLGSSAYQTRQRNSR